MVETPSAQRTVSAGSNYFTNSSSSFNTKPTNEYTWCYESIPGMPANNGIGFEEYLPRLEVDDKPLIYRQQFEPTVKNQTNALISLLFYSIGTSQLVWY